MNTTKHATRPKRAKNVSVLVPVQKKLPDGAPRQRTEKHSPAVWAKKQPKMKAVREFMALCC